MKISKEELAEILENHKKWVDTRYSKHVEGQPANLKGADLYGATLIGANLSGANLISANLDNANLREADLRYANLDNANLQNTNLDGAILYHANLNISLATSDVFDALAAAFSAQMALEKTYNDWVSKKLDKIEEI